MTSDFQKDLEGLINKHSQENGSNTPDWILANYLLGCLAAFNLAVTVRSKWFGGRDRIGGEGSPEDYAAVARPSLQPSHWLPSEVLYAFMGWLTSRPERVTLSAVDDAAPAADLVAEFCKRHHLAEPRDGWHCAIVHDDKVPA